MNFQLAVIHWLHDCRSVPISEQLHSCNYQVLSIVFLDHCLNVAFLVYFLAASDATSAFSYVRARVRHTPSYATPLMSSMRGI